MNDADLIAAANEALDSLNESPGGALTSGEWEGVFGLGRVATLRRLKALLRADKMERVRIRKANEMDGVVQPVWAYRLV